MTARRAFTLMEVLLAMALMMALLVTFFVFLRGSITAQESVRTAANEQLCARTLCDMIERDLMCCVAGDASSGSGVKGSAMALTILTRAVTPALATSGFEDRKAISDLETARFEFSESSKTVIIERSITEVAALPTPEHAPEESPSPVPGESVGPVERLRFRYYDGSTWHDSFDSLAEDRLPTAVEIALWLDPIPVASEEKAWSSEAEIRSNLLGASEEENARTAAVEEFSESTPEEAATRERDIPLPDVVRIVIIPDAAPGGGS